MVVELLGIRHAACQHRLREGGGDVVLYVKHDVVAVPVRDRRIRIRVSRPLVISAWRLGADAKANLPAIALLAEKRPRTGRVAPEARRELAHRRIGARVRRPPLPAIRRALETRYRQIPSRRGL